MATLKYIQGLSRSGFRVGTTRVKRGSSVQVDIDDRKTQLVLAGERENFVRTKASGTCTISNATPGVVTKNGHGFVLNDCVVFSTTGALPAPLVVGIRYFVISGGLTANAFEVSATQGGTAINTSNAGSGVHTVQPASVDIVGITRRGFRIQDTGGVWRTIKVGSGVTKVDLTIGNTLRVLRRNYGRFLYGLTTSALSVRGINAQQVGFDIGRRLEGTDTITLDSGANNAANTETVVVGSATYTFKTALTEAKATATLSGSGTTNVSDADTVTINDKTYRFKSTIAQIGDIHIAGSGNSDTSLTNLANAIKGTGVAGTDYFTGTVAPTGVTAGTVTSRNLVFTATAIGTASNSFASTKVAAVLAFGGATFSGGVNSVANEVVVGGSGDASLTSLAEAINKGANVGVDYSTATVANTNVSASAVISHAITLTGLQGSSDSITVSTTAAHLVVGTATVVGGHDLIYRGQTAVVNVVDPFNFQQLRRLFRAYIEAD